MDIEETYSLSLNTTLLVQGYTEVEKARSKVRPYHESSASVYDHEVI